MKKKDWRLINLVGWYGVLAVVAAYASVSFGWLLPGTLTYQLLNLTGAAAIALEAYYKKDYQPVALNLVWLLVALIALLR